MPHGIDAAMDDVESAAPDAAFDHVRGKPEPLQLPTRNDAVLLRRQSRQRSIRTLCRTLRRSERLNARCGFHAPDAGKEIRASAAQKVPS